MQYQYLRQQGGTDAPPTPIRSDIDRRHMAIVGIPHQTLHNPLNSFANTTNGQPLDPPSQEKVRPELPLGVVFRKFLRS